jgi:hypothetical protein
MLWPMQSRNLSSVMAKAIPWYCVIHPMDQQGFALTLPGIRVDRCYQTGSQVAALQGHQ